MVHTHISSLLKKRKSRRNYNEPFRIHLVEANNDDLDCTYRDIYIKIPEGKEKEYKEALNEVKEIYDSAGEE